MFATFILVIWWVWFRKSQDWGAILLYWFGGVFTASTLCAVLIFVLGNADAAIAIGRFLIPLGGLSALIFGAIKGRLNKNSGLSFDN